MRFVVLRIDEDIDFGCEERPDDEPMMSIVTIVSEEGDVRIIRHNDQLLYDRRINVGDIVFIKEDGTIEKKE